MSGFCPRRKAESISFHAPSSADRMGAAIEFGQFRVPDVEVNIVPNMAMDALLGMSVLRAMDIRQTDGVMRLSQR